MCLAAIKERLREETHSTQSNVIVYISSWLSSTEIFHTDFSPTLQA